MHIPSVAPMRLRSVMRRLLATATCAALAACGGDPRELVALQISPGHEYNVSRFSPGAPLQAFAVHADGTADIVAAEWSSSVPSVATMGACSEGYGCLVCKGVVGSTVVTATHRGFTASVKVNAL